MAINPALLIAAPMLQDYFVDDSTGLPLTAGTVSCYKDNDRLIFKRWYYQTGTPGNYTYLPLDNPLTLGAAGTIVDPGGNDVIPYFYPYNEDDNSTVELYYIVVKNSNGQDQFTRAGFPHLSTSSSINGGVSFNNLIVNNVFWRNVGSATITTSTQTFLCPSQHVGFNEPDINFHKDVGDGTDIISFNDFYPPSASPTYAGVLYPNDVTPEFYLNYQCTVAGTSTEKYISIPLSLHIKSLAGYPITTFTLEAMAVSVSVPITVTLYQFYGAGAVSPTPVISATWNLTTSWRKYTVGIPIAVEANPTLGAYDNSYYIRIGLPAGVTCNLNLAVPQFYLSSAYPANSFQSYSEVDAIISSPRSGDVKTSFNVFHTINEAGWVLMDDGVISKTAGTGLLIARANPDVWQLYSLLWNAFQIKGWQSLIPIYTSAGAPSTYGASAIADFNANKQLALPKALGRVFAGADYVGTYAETFTYPGSGNTLTVASTEGIFTGATIFVSTTGTLPTGLSANTRYFAIYKTTTTFSLATTYANAIAGTEISLSGSPTGTMTAYRYVLGGYTGQEQSTALLAHTHTLSSAGHTIDPLGSGGASFAYATISTGDGVTVHNSPLGGATDSAGSGTSFPIIPPLTYINYYIKL